MIKCYLGRLRNVLTILTRYRDEKSIQQLNVQKVKLEAMLAAAKNDDTEETEETELDQVEGKQLITT